jgi:hypothetical protein
VSGITTIKKNFLNCALRYNPDMEKPLCKKCAAFNNHGSKNPVDRNCAADNNRARHTEKTVLTVTTGEGKYGFS